MPAPLTPDAATVKLLVGLAEPTRLGVVRLLAAAPSDVTTLARALGLPVVNVSHHLSAMKTAGLVACVRSGRRMVYALDAAVYPAGAAALDLGGVVVALK